jgi:hypothetical protein
MTRGFDVAPRIWVGAGQGIGEVADGLAHDVDAFARALGGGQPFGRDDLGRALFEGNPGSGSPGFVGLRDGLLKDLAWTINLLRGMGAGLVTAGGRYTEADGTVVDELGGRRSPAARPRPPGAPEPQRYVVPHVGGGMASTVREPEIWRQAVWVLEAVGAGSAWPDGHIGRVEHLRDAARTMGHVVGRVAGEVGGHAGRVTGSGQGEATRAFGAVARVVHGEAGLLSDLAVRCEHLARYCQHCADAIRRSQWQCLASAVFVVALMRYGAVIGGWTEAAVLPLIRLEGLALRIVLRGIREAVLGAVFSGGLDAIGQVFRGEGIHPGELLGALWQGMVAGGLMGGAHAGLPALLRRSPALTSLAGVMESPGAGGIAARFVVGGSVGTAAMATAGWAGGQGWDWKHAAETGFGMAFIGAGGEVAGKAIRPFRDASAPVRAAADFRSGATTSADGPGHTITAGQTGDDLGGSKPYHAALDPAGAREQGSYPTAGSADLSVKGAEGHARPDALPMAAGHEPHGDRASFGVLASDGHSGVPGTHDWLAHRAHTLGDATETWARELPPDQHAAVENVLAPGGIGRLNEGLHSADPQIRAEAGARENAAKEALGRFAIEGNTTVYAYPASDHLTKLAVGDDITLGSMWSGRIAHSPEHAGSTEVVFTTRSAVDVSDLLGRRQVVMWSDTRAHVLAEEKFPPDARIGGQEPERRVFLSDLPSHDAPPGATRILKALASDRLDRPFADSLRLTKENLAFYESLRLELSSGSLYKINLKDTFEAPYVRPIEGVNDFGISGGGVDEFLKAHNMSLSGLEALVALRTDHSNHVTRSVSPLTDDVAQHFANESLRPIIYPTGDVRIDHAGYVHLRASESGHAVVDRSWRLAVPDADHIPVMPGLRGDDGIRRFSVASDAERYGAYLDAYYNLHLDEVEVVGRYQRTSFPYNDILRRRYQGESPAELNRWWDFISSGAPLSLFEEQAMKVNVSKVLVESYSWPLLQPLVDDLRRSDDASSRLDFWKNHLSRRLHNIHELYLIYGHFPSYEEIASDMAGLHRLTDQPLPEGIQVSRSLADVDFIQGFDLRNPDDLKALENTIQTEPAYMSVSLGDVGYWSKTTAAERYQHTMHLELPAGTRGFGAGYNEMYEVILAPGTRYRISRVNINPDGTTDYYGAIIPH